MEEIKEFLRAHNDKLKHGFFGPFIISWCVVNWKFIFFLIVSDIETSARINQAIGYTSIYTLLITPLGVALAHIYIMPYITYWFDKPKKQVIGWQDKNENTRVGILLGYKIDNARKEHEIEQERKGGLIRKEFEKTINELKNELKQKTDSIQRVEDEKKKWQREKADSDKKLSSANERITELLSLQEVGFNYRELEHIHDAEINKDYYYLKESYLKLAETYFQFKALRKRTDFIRISRFLKRVEPHGRIDKTKFYNLHIDIQKFLLKNYVTESKENALELNHVGRIIALFVRVFNESKMS